jgi:hypothetical protein
VACLCALVDYPNQLSLSISLSLNLSLSLCCLEAGRVLPEQRRRLVLVSKVMQMMANETDFQENKDPTTQVMEQLVRETAPFLQLAYANIVVWLLVCLAGRVSGD